MYEVLRTGLTVVPDSAPSDRNFNQTKFFQKALYSTE